MTGPPLWLAALLHLVATAALAGPVLTVESGGRTAIYTTAGLLGLPVATTVTVTGDPAYKRSMTFRAVPVAALLEGMAADGSVRFAAADGYATTLPAAPLLERTGPTIAYLAVEPADAPWPPLKAGVAKSAGPFYLVWTHPAKVTVDAGQWPYQITRIDAVDPLAKRFPMIEPAAKLAPNDPIRKGFAAFQRLCMNCHTLNGGGDATLGPDLNIPYNPTEYLRPDALRRLIRDPQALRRWPGSRMSGFDHQTLPDRDLAELIAYLRHMAERKVVQPVAK